MPATTAGPGLVTVCDRPTRAATAILAAWDEGRPVLVLDPRAPGPERDRALAGLRPDEAVGDDVAAVLCTSGTTGQPRGVELTWSGMEAAALGASGALGVGTGDRWLCCLPLHHVAGLAILARSRATGVPVTVLDRFDVARVEAASATSTLVSLVPTMARRLLAAGFDPAARFRKVLLGGAPAGTDLPGIRGYGLTETWGGVVYDGLPLPGTEVRIDAGGAGPSGTGEVLLRGPTLMRGYRLDPEATAAAFTGEGWLRTGDAGHLGADGRLHVVDRLGDLIITGGENVSPTEVEEVLLAHPGVADVAVAGRPDPEWGEVVVAWVVLTDPSAPPTLAELRAFAAERLSAAKLPRRLVLTDTIPRTAAGKPLRRLLREEVVG